MAAAVSGFPSRHSVSVFWSPGGSLARDRTWSAMPHAAGSWLAAGFAECQGPRPPRINLTIQQTTAQHSFLQSGACCCEPGWLAVAPLYCLDARMCVLACTVWDAEGRGQRGLRVVYLTEFIYDDSVLVPVPALPPVSHLSHPGPLPLASCSPFFCLTLQLFRANSIRIPLTNL